MVKPDHLRSASDADHPLPSARAAAPARSVVSSVRRRMFLPWAIQVTSSLSRPVCVPGQTRRVNDRRGARGQRCEHRGPPGLLSRPSQITPPGVLPGWCAERLGAATSLVPTLPSGSRYEPTGLSRDEVPRIAERHLRHRHFPATPDRRRALLVIGLAALLAQRVVLISAKPAPAELLAGFPAPYFKMLIARAITSAPMPRDTTASIIISSLAHRLIAEMSVGLNAVAVQNASER